MGNDGVYMKSADGSNLIAHLELAWKATQQLQTWRNWGYNPQLVAVEDGWILRLEYPWFEQQDFSARARAYALRFTTEPCSSPEAAKVIQP